eukprot:CAMPEP_0197388616 /NCGR_PEP_ID=MMETSP1165-20131217/1172_1 /TAXON_ID=284809 /ORGANISM="Chrysocystis fragilis, Strain CCMP3189" /LENGTH=348 /DNA_ID=CAMNT_0042913963 /DNA_START=51 /DNA_END=1095 /DNA_ORIENTATION=+
MQLEGRSWEEEVSSSSESTRRTPRGGGSKGAPAGGGGGAEERGAAGREGGIFARADDRSVGEAGLGMSSRRQPEDPGGKGPTHNTGGVVSGDGLRRGEGDGRGVGGLRDSRSDDGREALDDEDELPGVLGGGGGDEEEEEVKDDFPGVEVDEGDEESDGPEDGENDVDELEGLEESAVVAALAARGIPRPDALDAEPADVVGEADPEEEKDDRDVGALHEVEHQPVELEAEREEEVEHRELENDARESVDRRVLRRGEPRLDNEGRVGLGHLAERPERDEVENTGSARGMFSDSRSSFVSSSRVSSIHARPSSSSSSSREDRSSASSAADLGSDATPIRQLAVPAGKN